MVKVIQLLKLLLEPCWIEQNAIVTVQKVYRLSTPATGGVGNCVASFKIVKPP
jgi:hypothetical protein